ncbi:MAG: hypothetical protein AAFP97_03980 [Pseudomonadota bacterium]
MTHAFKTPLLSLALTSALIMSSSALAADAEDNRWTLKTQPTTSHTLIEPTIPLSLARIAPASDDIIHIGDPKVISSEPLSDVGSVFDAYRSETELSAMDIAAIEAEIEARFGMREPLAEVQTGISFEPDLTMLFKPQTPAKYQDPLIPTPQ